MSSSNQQNLEVLLASLADLRLTLNESGGVQAVDANSGLLRHLPRDAMIGRPWIELVRESDKGIAADALSAAQKEPGIAHRMDVALMAGPEEQPVPVTCWLCANTDDNSTQLACVDLRGETNLRQQLVNAQRTLEQDYWSNRRLEARYRRMLEMVAEGFLVVDDLSGRVLEANSVAASLLNLEEGALVGRVFPVGLDNDSTRVLTELQREARSTTAVVQGQVTTTDSDSLSIGVTCLRQSNETRLLIRLASISENQSDLGLGGDSFEASPDGILITDQNGAVIAANSAYLEMACIQDVEQATGRRADRWLGRSIVDLDVLLSNIHPDRPLQLFSSVLRTELGTRLDIELSAVQTEHSGKPLILMFIRDVSRRIGAEESTEVHLPRSIEQITGRVGRVPLKQLVRESTDVIEALCIEAALKLTQDNRAAAAELLGLSRQSLYTKLRRFDIGDSEDTVD
ncbi:MAG: transcriptional regulator PpsR [Luminiphilus sp.]|nr:transcriptional regulator PpsR [Luminiphilus sp.]